jgi:2-hydroxy-3-oxopropionate reductase
MQRQQKIGFIGLGIMGAPMAGHLHRRGHQLFVNTHGNTPEPFVSKATMLRPAAEVAATADIIFIMVPDTPDVEKVLFGEPGVGVPGPEGLATARWWST